MELWIRSQDKNLLSKIDTLRIGVNDIFNKDDLVNIWGNDILALGGYKTKERALEVLDEIQSKLKGTFLMKMKKDGYQDFIPKAKEYFEEMNSVCIVTGDDYFDLEPINKDIYVYEMPEE